MVLLIFRRVVILFSETRDVSDVLGERREVVGFGGALVDLSLRKLSVGLGELFEIVKSLDVVLEDRLRHLLLVVGLSVQHLSGDLRYAARGGQHHDHIGRDAFVLLYHDQFPYLHVLCHFLLLPFLWNVDYSHHFLVLNFVV